MKEKLQKIIEFLSGGIMTLISGAALAVSLIFLLADINSPFDPAWITLVISGLPMFYNAGWNIVYMPKIRKISSSLLISIAIIASVIIGEVFAAGEVAFIMVLGEILEEKTTARARKGIKGLLNLMPQTGRKITTDNSGITREETVQTADIAAGDILRVFPGEAIPVDGEIISGNTSVDQSVITGESLPVDKAAGDAVFCGTINRFGSVDIRAQKAGGDSSLQKMINMVKEAEENQAPMQRIVDTWAAWLVPVALIISVITYIVASSLNISDSLIRAVTVLVVFCPCALALATPTSIVAAIGQATKHGVLIKSGEALEAMGKVDYMAFDKTGTLTKGDLAVSDAVPLTDITETELLALAASAEARSEHPLARAIVSCAKDGGITLCEAAEFVMTPGKGVSALVEGKKVLCGSAAFLTENGVEISADTEEKISILRQSGKAVIIVAAGAEAIGVIALSDTVRQEAAGMITELSAMARPILLTGDNEKTANHLAARVGITEVHAGLLPEDKLGKVRALQQAGRKVCMIGDGVNDAPALKAASVGIAMGGGGTDIAVDAADIALVGDDISKLPYLKRLSNATVKTIKFNIAAAMLINFAAIILSVLGLLNPITGALVHNGGSIIVVLNAALLYDRKFKNKKIKQSKA